MFSIMCETVCLPTAVEDFGIFRFCRTARTWPEEALGVWQALQASKHADEQQLLVRCCGATAPPALLKLQHFFMSVVDLFFVYTN